MLDLQYTLTTLFLLCSHNPCHKSLPININNHHCHPPPPPPHFCYHHPFQPPPPSLVHHHHRFHHLVMWQAHNTTTNDNDKERHPWHLNSPNNAFEALFGLRYVFFLLNLFKCTLTTTILASRTWWPMTWQLPPITHKQWQQQQTMPLMSQQLKQHFQRHCLGFGMFFFY